MLPQKQRLSRVLFGELLQRGGRVVGPHVILSFLRDGVTSSAFACVVSKKTLPVAVSRNLLRRRGYRILRALIPAVSRPMLGAFFFKKGSTALSQEELHQEMLNMLKRAGAL